MSDIEDPSKLKVTELRAELQSRGLESKGNKAALVERLREALEGETGGKLPEKGKTNDKEKDCQDETTSNASEEQVAMAKDAVEREQNGQQDDGASENAAKESEEVAVKEEDEDECGKKADYEDAPMEDVDAKEGTEKCDDAIKREEEGDGEAEVKREETAAEEGSVEAKEEMEGGEEDGDRRGIKRPQSPSQDDASKKARPDVEEVRIEDEPEFDKTVVALDWYNSDLSLVISKKNRLFANPLTIGGFAYVWHGVRATYGCDRGRICFEVKVEDHLNVNHLEAEEAHPHVIRCGWSLECASLTLGEERFSYGYGGTGKASTNLKFKDYGRTFKKGDVVGCFVDLEAEPIVMSFTVNGEHQGICYEIPHAELEGAALFPHILTKNCSFKVNFGSEASWFEPLTGFTFISKFDIEDRVLSTQGPEKRDDAEAIMMVGLPAAGKTTWVDEYCRKMSDRKYNVLGTNNLIDKMKVMGLPRKRNYAGRWDNLIDKCTKCLNKLLYMATKRRRNFIIDQTNVYPSAQKRKIKGFAGCQRRAIVVCPTDDDLKIRTKKRESEEGKEVPDKAILEMKANFKLPDVGEFFDEIEFVELGREETEKLIEQYNKEGEKAGFGPKKFGRGNHAGRRGNFIDRRGGYSHRGGYRGGWDRDRDRRGSFDRRDRGSWNRDSRDHRERGNFNRDNRSGSFHRDRGNRGSGNWQAGFKGANQSNLKQPSTWSGSSQSSQGYGSQGWDSPSYSSPSWGQQQQQGYSSGYNWNQQYYGQQQPQQQSYWQGYGSQQTGYPSQTGYSAQGSYAPSSYGYSHQASLGQGQQQQQWSGYGSGYGQTGQYRK